MLVTVKISTQDVARIQSQIPNFVLGESFDKTPTTDNQIHHLSEMFAVPFKIWGDGEVYYWINGRKCDLEGNPL